MLCEEIKKVKEMDMFEIVQLGGCEAKGTAKNRQTFICVFTHTLKITTIIKKTEHRREWTIPHNKPHNRPYNRRNRIEQPTLL